MIDEWIDMTRAVKIVYTNHRGETATRHIVPLIMLFMETEWHPGRQWILHAYDLDKKASRDFAMKDITKWETIQ